MLDPVKLRVLRSVVETGSIRVSAEALGYTPSAVSQHLSALRKETGVTLLERSGRGIEVTPAGREIAGAAGTALDALDQVSRLATELRSGRTGTLAFAYVSSVAATWVPRIAQEVREEFPDLSLSLLHRDCSEDELDRRGDVVVADDLTPSFGDDWTETDLLEEGYSALVGAGHPLAGRETVGIADLGEHPWVTDDPLDSYWFERIASACRAAGFSPPVVANPPDYSAVLGFVALGTMISVQPSLIAQEPHAGIRAIPIAPPSPRRRIQVRVRGGVRDNPAAAFVVERLRVIAAEQAQDTPGIELM